MVENSMYKGGYRAGGSSWHSIQKYWKVNNVLGKGTVKIPPVTTTSISQVYTDASGGRTPWSA